jgi:ketosteroid isomerase-like protein
MAAVIEHKDFDEAEALLDPEIVWEHNLGEGSPEEGVYRGRGEVMGLFRRLPDAWREIRIDVLDTRPLATDSFEARGMMHFLHANLSASE